MVVQSRSELWSKAEIAFEEQRENIKFLPEFEEIAGRKIVNRCCSRCTVRELFIFKVFSKDAMVEKVVTAAIKTISSKILHECLK